MRGVASALPLLFGVAGCIAEPELFRPRRALAQESGEARARPESIGLHVGALACGRYDAITDVTGVRVGHCTVVEGEDVRTGVTVVMPSADNPFLHKLPAAIAVANGFGKLVGSTQVDELGELESPIALTNTLSVGAVMDALVGWSLAQPGCAFCRLALGMVW